MELMELVHNEAAASKPLPPIVLVVDDHDDTLDVYDAALSGRGYWVARAGNGLEALEYAQDLQPDAIVTDFGLPGHMTGADFIRELRTDDALRAVPVVVVTGREPRNLPSLGGIEMAALLMKPVSPETLVSRVEDALTSSGYRPRADVPTAAPVTIEDVTPLSPQHRVDKKRRGCPDCGARLLWVESRRQDGDMYDDYRECEHGCGLFCYNRATRAFEVLWVGHRATPRLAS